MSRTTTNPTRAAAFFLCLLPALLLLAPGLANAQTAGTQVFAATLTEAVQGHTEERGRAMAHLDGDELHLITYFRLHAGEWTSLALRHAQTGEAVPDVVYNVSPFPGDGDAALEWWYRLTADQLEALRAGLISVVVTTSSDPAATVAGPLQLRPAVERAFEVRLTSRKRGGVASAGGALGALAGDQLTLLGRYDNPFGRPWNSIDLYRAAPGEAGEHVRNFASFLFDDYTDAGFSGTITLAESEVQDLLARRLRLHVGQGPVEGSASGHTLPAPNRPPPVSTILEPAPEATLLIGGAGQADPGAPLATVSFAPVDDPDEDAVAYLWQASFHPNLPDAWSVSFELGVDSTSVELTAGAAAALYDSLARGVPIDVSPGTPVTVYHRVLTTDGSHYSFGATSSFTFVRGRLTANGPGGETPERFAVHGNYPNPFNPTTSVVFDLPAAARVAVQLYDLSGRLVLALPERPMAAGSMQQIEVDGAGLASGTYLYRILARTAAGVTTGSGRMLLLK